MKKYLSFILTVALCTASIICFGGTMAYSASGSMDCSDAMTRLENLGILDTVRDVQNGPDSLFTREEFAKALCVASGLDDEASSRMGATIYSDVSPDSSYSGYIGTAVEKGFMSGTADGMFHPSDGISFAQAFTIMVKALGYTDQDLSGSWPANYRTMAKQLGLVTDISLNNSDKLQRWAAAVMFNRLLYTNVKKNSASDNDVTFAEVSGVTSGSFNYGIITNPLYSRHEVATNFDPKQTSIGSIDLQGNISIVKDGEIISAGDIEENDVVYKVSDISGTKSYILVVDSKVQGRITGFTPSKMAPAAILIDGKSYQISPDMRFDKLSSFNVGDYATLLLGYDGKVVDFSNIQYEDNKSFAFVLNTGCTRPADSSAYEYTVKLLLIDGTIATYDSESDYSGYKGRLVKYKMEDSSKVSLTYVSYSIQGSLEVDKVNRKLDDFNIANNVKIFNIISDDDDQDTSVSLVKWSDIPSGTIPSGKILYMNESGSFDTVNVIVTDDLFGEGLKSAIVQDNTPLTQAVMEADGTMGEAVTGYRLTLMIDGKTYSYTSSPDENYKTGRVLYVDFSNNMVNYIEQARYASESSSSLQAYDGNRIKMDGTIYEINKDVRIYFAEGSGQYTLKGEGDIDSDEYYDYISLYLDKPLSEGGQVDLIIVHK